MNSVLHLIGLARKAGRLAVGEDPVGEAVKSREGKLLLVACDAAENTVRRAGHMAESGAVPCLTIPFTKAELGHTVGRSSCALLAFRVVGLACAAVEKLAGEDPEQYGAAAELLRTRARRALERQKERRTREKQRQAARSKPWAAPPKGKESSAPGKRSRGRSAPKGAQRRHET